MNRIIVLKKDIKISFWLLMLLLSVPIIGGIIFCSLLV